MTNAQSFRYVSLVLATCTQLLACGSENASDRSLDRDAIIAGTVVYGDPGGVAYISVSIRQGVSTHGDWFCSSVILNSSWILTAKHCVVDGHALVNPYDNITEWPARIWYGQGHDNDPNYEADGIAVHEREDVALVHFPPGVLPEVTNSLYAGSDQSLVGVTLSCYGYGASYYVDYQVLGGYGTLREADLLVNEAGWSTCGFDLFNEDYCINTKGYKLIPKSGGQILALGDSGGPCFLKSEAEVPMRVITGITNLITYDSTGQVIVNAWQSGAEDFRDWVCNTMGCSGPPGSQASCVNGECVWSCGAGASYCSGSCMDTATAARTCPGIWFPAIQPLLQ